MLETIKQVTDYLEAKGYKSYRNTPSHISESSAIWCKTYNDKNVPNCQCNDRPPQVVVTPWEFFFGNKLQHQSITIELTGEDSLGLWPRLKYSLTPEEVEEKFDVVVDKLYSAWNHLF